MENKKNIAKNYMYNLMYQILTIIIPLITTPYLSRVLRAENIGIYSYTLSIATYFILFGSLGVAMYGQREIAYVQNDKHKRSKIFYEILIMRFISLGISLILFYFCFCTSNEYSMYYKILILEIIATSVDISWFFQGLEEFKKTVLRNSIIKIISVICIFIFVRTSNDLVNYFVIYVSSNLLGNLTLWIYIPKFIKKISFNELNFKKHIKPTLSLFIPQIAMQIYNVLDKTMIGTIVDNKSEVGFYEQAQKMIKLLLTIATSFGTVMVPRMANTFANKDTKKLKEYMNISFCFILMVSLPLMFGFVSVSNSFVPMFYGPGFDKVKILIAVISPIILAISLSNVIGTQYLLPTKQQKKFTISVTCGAIVNFILNLILIKLFASIGASIATVIAEFVVTGIQFYFVRRDFSIITVIKRTYKYLLSSIIMFINSLIIGLFISNNIISIFVQVISSAFVYFLLLLILKDAFFLKCTKKIINKLKKEKLK